MWNSSELYRLCCLKPSTHRAPVQTNLHKPWSSHMGHWNDLEALNSQIQQGYIPQRYAGSFLKGIGTFDDTAEICPFINGSGFWSQASKQSNPASVFSLHCPEIPLLVQQTHTVNSPASFPGWLWLAATSILPWRSAANLSLESLLT